MKGGVGKTTLAVELAWYLHEKDSHNILLIDLDPQFNATQYLMEYSEFINHLKSKGTMADILIGDHTLSLKERREKKTPIERRLHRTNSDDGGHYFDLLPAELRLSYVVKAPAQMDFQLEKVLSKLRDKYDYIFIDCAPTDSVLTTMALNASDYVMVPVRPDRFAILGFANFLQSLSNFRDKCSDPHNVTELGVVFTQVSGDSAVEDECMSEVRSEAIRENSYVFKWMLSSSKSYVRAIRDQTPAYRTKYARGRPLANIRGISQEMKERIATVESKI